MPPSPPPSERPGNDSRSVAPAGTSDLSPGELAAAIAAPCIAVALAAVGFVLLARRWSRRYGWGGVLTADNAPRTGPGVTLLVTDIENSTLLWCVCVGGAPRGRQGWRARLATTSVAPALALSCPSLGVVRCFSQGVAFSGRHECSGGSAP